MPAQPRLPGGVSRDIGAIVIKQVGLDLPLPGAREDLPMMRSCCCECSCESFHFENATCKLTFRKLTFRKLTFPGLIACIGSNRA